MKAYILRTCSADMTSHNGFVWPRSGRVEAPDWKPTAECGNGLHGLLNGQGDGNLLDWTEAAVWVVAAVDAEQIIDINGKVKFPWADVIFAGDRRGAIATIQPLCAEPNLVVGATVTGGDRATVTGGYRATVTGGDRATVTGGDRATVTGGYRAIVTGGYRAIVTGGYESLLQLYYWDDNRRRVAVAYVGEGGIKPNTAHRLNAQHEFEEETT